MAVPPARILRCLVLGLGLASVSCGLVVGDAFDVRLDSGPAPGSDGGAPTDGSTEQAPEAATDTGSDTASPADSAPDSSDSSNPGDASDSSSTDDAGAPINLVQGFSAITVGGAATMTLPCPFTSAVTKGNMIIVAVQSDQSIMSVSDEQNPMYPTAGVGGTPGSALAIYYIVASAPGSQTVTVTFGSPAQAVVLIHEYSGLANQMPDPAQPFSAMTGTSVQAGPIMGNAHELLFAFGRSDSGLLEVIPPGFHEGQYAAGDLTETRVLPAAGMYYAPFTVSGDAGGDWQALLVTFVGA
jgi:hypothetical protein